MLVEGQIGPVLASDGTQQQMRQTRDSAIAISDAHGRYTESVSRGNVFTAANSAVQVLTLGVAAATGLVLSNPAGSGKNLFILEIQAWIAAAVTAVADVALFANVNPVAAVTTHTTPLVVRPTLLGNSNTSVGLADSSATLPAAPVLLRPLFGWHWVTGGTPTAQLGVKDEVAGAVGIAPGCAVSIQGVTVAHSILGSITWEELPV